MSEVEISTQNNYLFNLNDNEKNNYFEENETSDFIKTNLKKEEFINNNFMNTNFYLIKSKASNLKYKNNIRNLFKI